MTWGVPEEHSGPSTWLKYREELGAMRSREDELYLYLQRECCQVDGRSVPPGPRRPHVGCPGHVVRPPPLAVLVELMADHLLMQTKGRNAHDQITLLRNLFC